MGEARLSRPQIGRRALHQDTGLHASDDIGEPKAPIPEHALAEASGRIRQKGFEGQLVAAEDAAVALQCGSGHEIKIVALATGGPLVGDDASECPADPAEARDDEVDGLQEIPPGNPPNPPFKKGGKSKWPRRSRELRDASIFI